MSFNTLLLAMSFSANSMKFKVLYTLDLLVLVTAAASAYLGHTDMAIAGIAVFLIGQSAQNRTTL